jgi:transcriptional regulator with XRE-family HTH domain
VDEHRGGGVTLFDSFIEARRIDVAELANVANVSVPHIARLRSGQSVPTRGVMIRIARACSWITRETVYGWELFDRLR